MNRSEKFYSLVLGHLRRSNLSFMVGGSYALMHHMGTKKIVKDLDIVCEPADALRILKCAKQAGFKTEFTYKNWLGKIFNEKDYIDVIFRTSNKRIEVKKEWFKHGRGHVLFGEKVFMLSPEEVIINKMYVFGRDCYHGHDIYKLVHKLGSELDWKRIWKAIQKDWQILEAHIVLFDFVFPKDRYKIPDWLRSEIGKNKDKKVKTQSKFQGHLLSLVDYPIKGRNKLHNHPLKVGKNL
jgi:hypothetical protein